MNSTMMRGIEYVSLFKEPKATNFELMRLTARSRKRIVYDCRNTIVFEADRARCKAGHSFASRVNTMPMEHVLSGRGWEVYQDCKDYTD